MWQFKDYKKEKSNILDSLFIKSASKEEYNKLKNFHYINTNLPAIVKNIFGLFYSDYGKEILVGIIVYSAVSLRGSMRKYTPLKNKLKHIKNKGKYLYDNCVSISRIIIHPSLRGCGAARFLIDNSVNLTKERYIEIIAEMLYYYNFLPTYFFYKRYTQIINDSREFFEILNGNYSRNNRTKQKSIIKRIKPIRFFGYGFLDKKTMKNN